LKLDRWVDQVSGIDAGEMIFVVLAVGKNG
jgi:hypothetical protein